MAFVNVNVGNDRIVLTAFNPSNGVTLLKCRFLLERIASLLQWVDEAEFLAWVEAQPGGVELVEQLKSGWEPERLPPGTVDPLNAREETRILGYLMEERASQRARSPKGGR